MSSSAESRTAATAANRCRLGECFHRVLPQNDVPMAAANSRCVMPRSSSTPLTSFHTSRGTVSTLGLPAVDVTIASSRAAVAPRSPWTPISLRKRRWSSAPEMSSVQPSRYPVLCTDPYSRADPEPQQEPAHVVDQPAARRGVVDPSAPTVLGDGHRSVRGPQVMQEQPDLPLREREHLLGDVLLVRAEAEDTEPVEPADDRVATPASEAVGRRKAQCRDARCGVVVADRGDAEMLSGRRDDGEVALVARRVAQSAGGAASSRRRAGGQASRPRSRARRSPAPGRRRGAGLRRASPPPARRAESSPS